MNKIFLPQKSTKGGCGSKFREILGQAQDDGAFPHYRCKLDLGSDNVIRAALGFVAIRTD